MNHKNNHLSHRGYSRINRILASAVLIASAFAVLLPASAEPLPPMDNRTDLALGKEVLFSPAPKGTKEKNSGLTDGKISTRADHDLSQDTIAASWSYAGRVNLAVDLGAVCDIDEIAIRLQNGSPVYTTNSGRMFPGWVEAFVSDDGEQYTKVAEFSHWNAGEFEKFGIGQERGSTWIDTLRFKNLKARGRWVGLRFYSTARSFSDELYVFGSSAAGKNDVSNSAVKATGFSVKHPEFYFHKPYLELANNIPLPVPVGFNVPADKERADLAVDIDVPPGVELKGGIIASQSAESIKPQTLPDGWQRYSFSSSQKVAARYKGRLFLQASSWKDGQEGELRYRFTDQNWQSPSLTIPIRAVHVPAAPRLKKIMTSLGYWNSPTAHWPDDLSTLKTIGINTYSVMAPPDKTEVPQATLKAIDAARKQGFFISSAMYGPLRPMLSEHLKDRKTGGEGAEVFDIFADGTYGTRLCPSYRGKYYWQEIDRFAHIMAAIKPDFSTEDLELWANYTGFEKCVRCQADQKKSGLSWDDWKKAKAKEISGDIVKRTKELLKAAGKNSFDTGIYNVSPEHVYDGGFFDFDQLYPDIITQSQGSTYTSLQPADITYIGDKARNARQHMKHSDGMPIMTPGDAGTFPGKNLEWAILECYTNGSRGIWFWSDRMWDSEDLIAYNKVVRAIAPVEDIIVDGDLVGQSAVVDGPGRISGMKLDSRMVLLAADYFGKSGGTMKLHLDVTQKSTLRDLFSGETIGAPLEAGAQTVSIPLNGESARLVEVVPVTDTK